MIAFKFRHIWCNLKPAFIFGRYTSHCPSLQRLQSARLQSKTTKPYILLHFQRHDHFYIHSFAFSLNLLVEFGLNPAIPDTIDFQLKPQARAINNHLKCKVQVVKLDTSRCSQACEQTPRYGIKICRQCTHVDKITRIRSRWFLGITGNKIVGYYERLSRAEVACVMERNR